MNITIVSVSCLFNVGNYENQKFELTAKLEEGDAPAVVADALKHAIHEMADKREIYYERQRMRNDLIELEGRIDQAREEWEATRTFLLAQGLRPDAPEFPIAARKALAAADAESVETEVLEDDHNDHKYNDYDK